MLVGATFAAQMNRTDGRVLGIVKKNYELIIPDDDPILVNDSLDR
jgi:hypothetical protein